MGVNRLSILNKTEVNLNIENLINYRGLIFSLQIPCTEDNCASCPQTENCLIDDCVTDIVMESTKKHMWYLQTYSGNNLYCTEDQELYLTDGSTKKAKDIEFGDYVILISGDTTDLIINSEKSNFFQYPYNVSTTTGKAFINNFLLKTE